MRALWQLAGADVSAAEAVGETEDCLERLVAVVHRIAAAQSPRVTSQLRAAGCRPARRRPPRPIPA